MKQTFVCLLILVIYGCAHADNKGIEDRAMHCEPVESEECIKLRARADRFVEKQRKVITCPEGFVLYKDNFGDRCVSEREVRKWLRSLQRQMNRPM